MAPAYTVDDTVNGAVGYAVDSGLLHLASPLAVSAGFTYTEDVLGGEFSSEAVLAEGVVGVVLAGTEEQVFGVHAGTGVTVVQDAGAVGTFAFGDRPFVYFPAKAVCEPWASPEPEVAVSILTLGASPDPAGIGFVHLNPKPL